MLTVSVGGVLQNDTSPSGSPLTAALVAGPAHGSLTLNADGSFTYAPTAGYVGIDTFTYTASDGIATSSPATVTLNVTDQAPVVADSAYNATPGSALFVPANGVLANDSDPDQDSLKAILSTAPANGSLTLNADGSFTYTPKAGFLGKDSFQYQANDGALGTTATVTITVDAPPQVTSVVANDGSAQRSMVTSITVTFSELVTLSSDPTTAFQLTGPNGAVTVSASVGLDSTGTKTQVVLTFTGPGIINGSLPDGRYTLTVLSSAITDSSGQHLDGDANGTAGGNDQVQFFRLFGDVNGDGTVSKQELSQFNKAYGTKPGQKGYLWYFDYDGLNGIDSVDKAQITKRVGTKI
jgi:VCBS repeat-containing protein